MRNYIHITPSDNNNRINLGLIKDKTTCSICPDVYPVKVYQIGGIQYTNGTYKSLEVCAYDANDDLVYSWKGCNSGTISGDPIYLNQTHCCAVLKGQFDDSDSAPITITIGIGGGSILSHTVTVDDLNFDGASFSDNIECSTAPSGGWCFSPIDCCYFSSEYDCDTRAWLPAQPTTSSYTTNQIPLNSWSNNGSLTSQLTNICSLVSLPQPGQPGYTPISGCKPVHNATQDLYYWEIQPAINEADPYDEIYVEAGRYVESLTIDKPIKLWGPNLFVPASWKNRTELPRLQEAVIEYPASLGNGGKLVNITSDDVDISGFSFEFPDELLTRQNPITYGYLIYSIQVNDLTIENNKFYGSEIPIYNPLGPIHNSPKGIDFGKRQGLLIQGNYIDCGPFVNSVYNRAIYCADIAGTITENTIVNCNIGIQFMSYNNENASSITKNEITAGLWGLYHNVQYRGTADTTWDENEITVAKNDRNGLKALVSGPGGSWNGPVQFAGIVIRGVGMVPNSFRNPDGSVAQPGQPQDKPPELFFTFNVINTETFADHNVNNKIGVLAYGGSVSSNNNVSSDSKIFISHNDITNYTIGIKNEGSANIQAVGNYWLGGVLSQNVSTGTITTDPVEQNKIDTNSNTPGVQP